MAARRWRRRNVRAGGRRSFRVLVGIILARVSCVLVVGVHSGLFALVVALVFFNGLVVWNVYEAPSVGVILVSHFEVSRGCFSRSSLVGSPGYRNQARIATSINSHHQQK